MTMQRLCHAEAHLRLLAATLLLCTVAPVHGAPPVNDYPTHARVEFVNDCIAKHGGKLSQLYQCSCAIDRIANAMNYDEFVEASTFAKYATLPGEGGAIFRDSDEAKDKAKRYRELEKSAYRECGVE